jgi:predicted permease
MREWKNRLLHPFRRRAFDADLEDELRFHLDSRTADLIDEGLSPPDAALRARREFGSVAHAGESARAVWQFRWLADFVADFRLSLRSLCRTPAFALTAIATLALGIGATSAIFSMMDAALWRPLPVHDPHRLVRVGVDRGGRMQDGIPVAFVQQLRQSPAFEGIIVSTGDGLSFEYGGRAERIVGEVVAPDYFGILGVRPMLGRTFTPTWAPEAVLSYRFWRNRFGGDPSVLGRTIRLNTRSFTIVGVAPPEFYGTTRGRDFELYLPVLPAGVELRELSILSAAPEDWVDVMARLRPGATAAEAQATVDAQLHEFLQTHPSFVRRFEKAGIRRARVLPGDRGFVEEDVQGFSTPLYTLLALAALVLLIACANVASMLLARSAARSREFAIRCSIGAGRGRIVRQMLAESLALSALGGLAGLALAGPAGRTLFAFLPQGHIAMVVDIRAESRVVLFHFAVMLLTGLAFGLAAALAATRGDFGGLKIAGRASGSRLRGILVGGQAAFSLVLLIAAGAFVQQLSQLRPAEFGRAPERVLLFTIKPQPELYPPQRLAPLLAELVRRISALPGVQVAALADYGPLGSLAGSGPVTLPDGSPLRTEYDTVTPGFFEAVGIARVAGRDFQPIDRDVVIVNQSLARALFGDTNPIGRTLTIPSGKPDGRYEIVGVVADTHYFDPHRPPQPGLWIAASQRGLYMPTLFVRSARPETGALMTAIRHALDDLDPGFPVFNIRTFEMRIRDSMARERMVAEFSGALGSLALVMAAVGLYGLLAYAVTRRTREIGVRMALGSSAADVVWLVTLDGVRPIAWGAAVGAILSTILARLLPSAPAIGLVPVMAAVAMMCVVGVAAAVLPAMRAARIDPLTALRTD